MSHSSKEIVIIYYSFWVKIKICWCTYLHRFSLVGPGNIVRLLAPDLGILLSSLFVLRLCNKLTRPAPQVNLHENGIPATEAEVKARWRWSFMLHVQLNHPDCSSGLSGRWSLCNRVWGGKWHGRILLWQLRGDHGASSVGPAPVCPEADNVCSRTQTAAFSNHEHSRESGGDFPSGSGRYTISQSKGSR